MRVVALTADASLAVALTMMDGWEIIDVHDIEEAIRSAKNADVVLVGVGGSDEGLAIVEQMRVNGVAIPSVVVGDTPGVPGARTPVLTRPFSLDDIRTSVEQAVGASTPPPPVQEPVARPAAPAPPPRKPVEIERRFGKDKKVPREPSPTEAEVEQVGEASSEEPMVLDEPLRSDEPPPVAPPVAPPPARPPSHVQVRPEYEQPKARKRFGRKPQPSIPSVPAAAAKLPLDVRMKAAIVAAKEIEQLLRDLPLLADRRRMAQALLGEAVEMFSPDTGGVLVRTRAGFAVFAGSDLSKTEIGMTVPADQALILELTTTGEAVHIAPVDLARGLVLGIPGTRSEALIAAPIILDSRVEAVIFVCKDSFDEQALEQLDDLAREGAPGFAVALALDGLRQG